MRGSSARVVRDGGRCGVSRYSLSVAVDLPAGMRPADFLRLLVISWSDTPTVNPVSYAVGPDLDRQPRFIGPVKLRRKRAGGS